MTAVHQFVATFEPGAIGNEIVQAQKVLRDAGYTSEIFSEYGHDDYEGQWSHHTAYAKQASADDVLVYHMAIGSNVADWLIDRSETLILRHHNITPVDFYSPWPDANTYGMAWGRDQLRQFAQRASLGLAASEFNRQELESLRYRRTAVAPVFFDFTSLGDAHPPKQNATTTNWLFVGWLAPHKCQHDVILAFSMYRRLFDESAQLHLVGRTALDSYEESCRKLVSELGLDNAVTFSGRVSHDELKSLYENADVFVCMSEHEGVGLPLLESMYCGLPIVAYGASAIPETVGDGGIVLPTKKPATVAATVNRLMTDNSLRNTLRANAARQVKRFDFDSARNAWLSEIKAVVESR